MHIPINFYIPFEFSIGWVPCQRYKCKGEAKPFHWKQVSGLNSHPLEYAKLEVLLGWVGLDTIIFGSVF